MKACIALILASTLITGCVTQPTVRDAEIIIKYKYIVNTIPADMLSIPAQVGKVDPTIDSDDAIATWMLDGEKRYLEIEGKLRSIKDLQDDRLKELEKLSKDDVIIK